MIPLRFRCQWTAACSNSAPVVAKAADRLLAAASVEYKDFCTAQSFWLDDYALFMAVKAEQGQAGLCDPAGCRPVHHSFRRCSAARERLAGQVDLFGGQFSHQVNRS